MAHIHGRLQAVGEVTEECCWKVGEGVQTGEVDHHHDAKTDEPGFIQFLSWRSSWRDKYHAEKDARDDKAEDKGKRLIAVSKDYVAPLWYILVVVDLIEESHLLELHELLACLSTDL